MALDDWNNDGRNDFMDDFIEQAYIFDDDGKRADGPAGNNSRAKGERRKLSVFENVIAGGFIALMIAGIADQPALFLPIFIPVTAFFIWASS